MKICLIAASPKILGGQAVQAAEIVRRFKREGIEIDFLPVNPELNGFFGFCQKIKFVRTIVTSFAYLASLLREVPKYDVLHIFSASYFSFILAPTPAVLIGKLFKKKILLNYHSGEAEDHLMRSESTIKRVLSCVDQVVVPSGYLESTFGKFGIKAETVFNIINEKDFPFKKRALFRPKFIVPRNLIPMYNVSCVLKAFRLIQDEHPDSELTVLGYGSEEQSLKKLSRDLHLKKVHFAGRVERDEIAGYYEQSDFMLNASLIDNMPITILEAFFAGLPVITTDTGGIPYIIRDGENGCLVPQNDEKALATRVLHLLAHQEVARGIADKAHRESLEKYTWEANREKWLELYGMSQQ